MPGEEPQFLDDDHAAIHAFAENYLDEDERDEFVDGLLERRGYVRVSSWAPPEPDEPQRKPAVKPRTPQAPAPAAAGQRRSPYFKR